MVAALARPGRVLAKQMLLIELSAVILVAIGLGLAVNPDWGFAALVIGGGIFVIANVVFCVCAFLFCGARATS